MKTITLNQMEMVEGGRCNGQRTMDCINFNYNQNGWTSFLLWTATIIDPPLGLVVAGSCALAVCAFN